MKKQDINKIIKGLEKKGMCPQWHICPVCGDKMSMNDDKLAMEVYLTHVLSHYIDR